MVGTTPTKLSYSSELLGSYYLCTCLNHLNLTQTKAASYKSFFQKPAPPLKVCSPVTMRKHTQQLRGWLSLPFHLDEVFQSHQVLLHYPPFGRKPHYKLETGILKWDPFKTHAFLGLFVCPKGQKANSKSRVPFQPLANHHFCCCSNERSSCSHQQRPW